MDIETGVNLPTLSAPQPVAAEQVDGVRRNLNVTPITTVKNTILQAKLDEIEAELEGLDEEVKTQQRAERQATARTAAATETATVLGIDETDIESDPVEVRVSRPEVAAAAAKVVALAKIVETSLADTEDATEQAIKGDPIAALTRATGTTAARTLDDTVANPEAMTQVVGASRATNINTVATQVTTQINTSAQQARSIINEAFASAGEGATQEQITAAIATRATEIRASVSQAVKVAQVAERVAAPGGDLESEVAQAQLNDEGSQTAEVDEAKVATVVTRIVEEVVSGTRSMATVTDNPDLNLEADRLAAAQQAAKAAEEARVAAAAAARAAAEAAEALAAARAAAEGARKAAEEESAKITGAQS
ncbi:hypothetical protein [Thiomicrospira microaerophila]|uniref:hypothetical protein n=1 Tax=Thiomicrospira microaerophila TaxID=406020 RepID=UPI000698BEA1|nr:hypothetical protein [Thiomicrospira microaerophila]